MVAGAGDRPVIAPVGLPDPATTVEAVTSPDTEALPNPDTSPDAEAEAGLDSPGGPDEGAGRHWTTTLERMWGRSPWATVTLFALAALTVVVVLGGIRIDAGGDTRPAPAVSVVHQPGGCITLTGPSAPAGRFCPAP